MLAVFCRLEMKVNQDKIVEILALQRAMGGSKCKRNRTKTGTSQNCAITLGNRDGDGRQSGGTEWERGKWKETEMHDFFDGIYRSGKKIGGNGI